MILNVKFTVNFYSVLFIKLNSFTQGYLEEVSDIAAAHGSLKPSEAVMSTGHNLSSDHVIHVNGPEWGDGGRAQQEALEQTVKNALSLADGAKFSSIAFPSISSGQ